jgi:predicted DNA-binding protein YlxM (UPF0122 family)
MQVIRHRNKVDVGKALKMRFEKGMTLDEIGKVFGVDRSAIHHALKPFKQYLDNPESVRAFNEHKTSLLSVVEQELVSRLLNKDTLKKGTVNNLAYALGTVHNINRLEQGKATQNINIQSMIQHTQAGISEATEALRAIQEQLQVSTGSGEGAGEVMHINDNNGLRDDLT